MRMDEKCQELAIAFAGAAEKAFDDVPNREQLGDFFDDSMKIITIGNEAADWPEGDRLKGLWRFSGYLNLELSMIYGKMSDEIVVSDSEPAEPAVG